MPPTEIPPNASEAPPDGVSPGPVGREWLETQVKAVEDDLEAHRPLLDTTPSPLCRPHAFHLDEKTRTVTCGRCKGRFEAFDAILHIAKEWRHFVQNKRRLTAELQALGERRDQLRHDIKLAKAKVRRADPLMAVTDHEIDSRALERVETHKAKQAAKSAKATKATKK